MTDLCHVNESLATQLCKSLEDCQEKETHVISAHLPAFKPFSFIKALDAVSNLSLWEEKTYTKDSA